MVEAPHLPLAAARCGALLREHDWSRTPLGPLATWPQTLRTTVGLVLHSVVPIVLLWGEDGIMIYNDAYSVFAGGRHPILFGSKVREGWPEVADFNDNVHENRFGGRHACVQRPGIDALSKRAARAGLDEPRLLAGAR